MINIRPTDTVGAAVARHPALARVFERVGIDFCCGGTHTLAHACRQKGLDATALLDELEHLEDEATEGEAVFDPSALSLSELADHIEHTHHAYLRAELPRLDQLAGRVAAAHGSRDRRVLAIRETLFDLAGELLAHLLKEERILFPLIRQVEAGDQPLFPGLTLARPMRRMELEHDGAGAALARLRELTDGYTVPAWGCNTYRALLDGLAELERDTHRHIHKENNVLFPAALALERRGQAATR
jgi:regulator of cell morphogenesis and NO signaling